MLIRKSVFGTHHLPPWRGGQAPHTLAVEGFDLLLVLLVTKQLFHMISVQLISSIRPICCPDVVLSNHAVLGEGFPVKIPHPGGPPQTPWNEAFPRGRGARRRRGRRWRRWWRRWQSRWWRRQWYCRQSFWLHLIRGSPQIWAQMFVSIIRPSGN